MQVMKKKRYYTNVFHSINREGTKLTSQESRAVLYYQREDNSKRLNPEFCKSITSKDLPMDFVRYLALLSNYERNGGNVKYMAKGYSVIKSRENLYEEFVYAFPEKDFNESDFKLDIEHYDNNLRNLQQAIENLEGLKDKKCDSIIEMDYLYAGLIYLTMIKGETVNTRKWTETKTNLYKEINNVGKEHKKAPSQLKNLRNRFNYSITQYKQMFEP